ncbi:MAG: type II CRISPR RNA-guided endonuclease Cas9 [Bacteroidales bacterium]|nr:type II CRISPR RNA-guided endonuclease Cas9 [Bacteroidales bacterium]
MKKILGLDLGTTSIGWAFVKEAETEIEKSEIIKLGVRVNPLSTDELQDFEKGKSISINADRTLKRGARRNLFRYKMRRNVLIETLKNAIIINENTVIAEDGKNTTFQTLKLRSRAASEKIEKDEFARVLLSINKKRGYKSSRKAKNEDEGQVIDGMAIAKELYERNITPGQYSYEILQKGKKVLPDFYRSDLMREFKLVWDFQKQFYPDIFDDELLKALDGQGQQNSRKRFLAIKGIYTAENKGKRDEVKLQAYKWRSSAIKNKLDISEVAYVLVEINNDLNKSSGYLGSISDRSKELYFNNETVGQYLYKQIQKNRHTRLKGQVFYRQDYLDEFEKLWETQKLFHNELTDDLKKEIRDLVIFYQRPLKSQKGLISFCEFERGEREFVINGKKISKTIGQRVCPKSSPLFQEFKIWQILSNAEVKNKKTREKRNLSIEEKDYLFNELNVKGKLHKADVLKLLFDDFKDWDINYKSIEGNKTNRAFYDAYKNILVHEGNDGFDIDKLNSNEIKETIRSFFLGLGINEEIFLFNAEVDGKDFEKQSFYQLWHLLYSYEGDNSPTGNDAIFVKLEEKYGFRKEHAQYLLNIELESDYSSLSTKAIRKIFPYIKENKFSEACILAEYNHSHSLTKEENEKRILKEKLDVLPKNSLRNPVVEKILNQMANLINQIIEDPDLGKPDEIRIELARDLKKSAKERADMTSAVYKASNEHEQIKTTLRKEFGIQNPSRNDIIRYKLYKELKDEGYKTLYSNKYISPELLFSKEVDIEHIIPQARLFDDSFSNKTLEFKSINIEKGEDTAYDYVSKVLGDEALENYLLRIEKLFKDEAISKAKYLKLQKRGDEIGEGFIERDLRESQYIAKKAKDMLLEICRTVVSTSGSITGRLREDWGLINTMKEINLPKFRTLGLTEFEERKDGQKIEKIIDWTKRNDHRHHAMDALTVAFTKHSHIQYLNNLNARKNENDKKYGNIIAIEKKETEKDVNGKRVFKEPIPNFRQIAKKCLEEVLISHKTKNKVVTNNKNKIKGSEKNQIVLTPRGQLHKETIYGSSKKYETKIVKIGSSFDLAMANMVGNSSFKEALICRLEQFDNDPKKAFGGKNALSKTPLLTKNGVEIPEKVKIVWFSTQYTIRKDISPDLKIEKVVDKGIQKILQKRLADFKGDAKAAFSNLEQNPIWLNKEEGISIKSVTISGVSNAEALHTKKDHLGNSILDKNGKEIPVDYVSTGNNHHVAIYQDEEGNLQEEVVSFYEAVARVNAGVPVINVNHPNGWQFLFTLKQNELFVFPNKATGFDPKQMNLMDPKNYALISPNLFRVQKMATKDYFFRHHLETNVETNSTLKGITWKREGLSGIKDIVKVRINHIGKIVQVGE